MDTTFIAEPSSAKKQDGTRDLEMPQTKKGNRWHFGTKANIVVDTDFGLASTVLNTVANVS
jgi:transposase, IS5 family